MHYLIDGYNLIFRVLSDEGSLEEQRDRIIRLLSQKTKQTDFDLTLIFDAQHREGEITRTHFRDLEILFSGQGETADDLILTMIEGTEMPRHYTVVTSDKKLASTARRFGGKTQTIRAFLKMLDKKKATDEEEVKPTTGQEMDYYLEQFEEKFKNGENN